MEINVREESRLVEVWLTKEEKNNSELQKQLKPLYKKYKAKNYLVAVYASGERELWDCTSDLLNYNRMRIAQLELAREKQRSTASGCEPL